MTTTRWPGLSALATIAALGLLAPQARADEQTVKLIQLLIQKGILTKGQASELLSETTATPRPHARRTTSPYTPPSAEAEAPEAKPGEVRVTYVPQFIRRQIADQVRAQMMSEVQQEGWAAPDSLPEWTHRVKIYGDLRLRAEGDLFDNNNYNQFVNFNAINAGSPFDVQQYNYGQVAPPPFLDTTQDRERIRLRARLGARIQVDDNLLADIRIATGSDPSPISPNQTLGAPGDFSKYALWLDRGYFKFDPLKELTVYAGRSSNPFFTSDLLFYYDLGFDGFSAQYHQYVGGGVDVFATGGVFPLFNTALDFSTNQQDKFRSRDAWLFGLQGGATWHINPEYVAKLGIGWFDFDGAQGSVSSPCASLVSPSATPVYQCNSDNTRPPFQTFGNTVYEIRDIIQPAGANNPYGYNPQYFGLASRFNLIDIHPRFDILTYHPIDIALEGDFIDNLGFNRDAILHHGPTFASGSNLLGLGGGVGPANNIGAALQPGGAGPYQGGNIGYMVKGILGHLEIHKPWEWNAYLAYKHLETDATLDSITDPDFHLGGTNAQGYILGGNLGVGHDTFLALKWLSAQTISGPHYGVNVVQLDLQSSF